VISYLAGTIVASSPGSAVLLAGAVGYEVMVGSRFPLKNGPATLWIWQHQTDKGVILYGFESYQERQLARMVEGTDGIGPKIAHKVVTELGHDAIARAVVTGDSSGLRVVKGVGSTKMTNIINHLKQSGELAATVDPRIGQALAALRSLGHDIEAAEAILIPLASQQPTSAVSSLTQQVIVQLARNKTA
jgi:Holliday junction DNA helicase RuvA